MAAAPLLLADAEPSDIEEAFYRSASDSSASLKSCWEFLGGPADKLGLAVNTIRDFVWTYLSIEDYSVALTATSNSTGQMNGQFLYSTIAMIPALIAGMYFAKPDEFPRDEAERAKALKAARAEMVVRVGAASASVYAWDLGQTFGITLGVEKLGLSAADAGYFASIFTGVFEGAMQTVVITFAQTLCSRFQAGESICSFEAFKEATMEACKALPLGVTLNAVPGAVWQLIYNACAVAGGINPLAASALVAIAVLAANIGVSKLIGCMQPALEESLNTCLEGSIHSLSGRSRGREKEMDMPFLSVMKEEASYQTGQSHSAKVPRDVGGPGLPEL